MKENYNHTAKQYIIEISFKYIFWRHCKWTIEVKVFLAVRERNNYEK